MSVVVPVFRPGAAFDDLVASLDRQSLDHSRFEVLLCDDGSGEETALRLADAASTRPWMRVIELPHSGWPGTPRNRGIDEARGDYIQFVDQDDWLFDRALESLCDFADLHRSDVIVGKEVGIGRPLPTRIFQRDVPHARLGTDPLLEMLTPHKMFRTSFLRTRSIRFPEGKVRLEDHLFVMQAYFEASVISIFASEPCYAWVKHAGSASSARIDPETYFPHLEAVLDLVERYTQPGHVRDRLLRHWFRGKILKRVAGKRMLRQPAEYRQRLLDVVVPLSQRRFGPGVDGGLAFPHRIRAALLRANRRDDLVRFAEFETSMTCTARVASAHWSRGGGLYLKVEVGVTRDGVDALQFEPGSRRLVDAGFSAAGLPSDVMVAGREVENDRIELFLRDKTAGVDRRIAAASLTERTSVTLAIDPLKVFAREDSTRGARLVAKVRRAGWTFEVPLTSDPATLSGAAHSPLLAGRSCAPVATRSGAVELRRSWPRGRVKDFAGRAVRGLRHRARGR